MRSSRDPTRELHIDQPVIAQLSVLNKSSVSHGGRAARPRIGVKPQPYPRAAQRSTCRCRSYRTKEKRVPEVIIAHPGLLSYEVSVAPNTVWRWYIDQPKETAVTPNSNKEQCTPQLDPAFLEGISQATSSVGSEEPQTFF